jgi:hypothetical protein
MKQWDDFSAGELVCEARVDPEEIGYVCALIEAHEGLAVVRTKDEALGIVEFWISPLMQKDFHSFLEALSKEIPVTHGPLKRLTPPVTLNTEKRK